MNKIQLQLDRPFPEKAYFSEIPKTTGKTMRKPVWRYLFPVLGNHWRKFIAWLIEILIGDLHKNIFPWKFSGKSFHLKLRSCDNPMYNPGMSGFYVTKFVRVYQNFTKRHLFRALQTNL